MQNSQREPGSSSMPLPLYYKIHQILRGQISSGELAQGQQMPTEKELASTYSVSRITIRRVMDDLAREGLIHRSQGKGNFVLRAPVHFRETASSPYIYNFMDHESVVNTRVDLLSSSEVKMSPYLASLLNFPDMDSVHKAIRLRHDRKTPISYITSFCPMYISGLYSDDELRMNHPLSMLVKSKGVQFKKVQQAVSAVLSDGDVSSALKIELGSPLLKVVRSYIGEDDKGVLCIQALYNTNKVHMRMEMAL